VDLRPAKNIKTLSARIDRINPYAASLATELPRRYEWSYELKIPSAGVPLTDSLAFVFRTADGRIAARVAARL
jgi:ketosteroid isomerase-like protein